MFIVKKNKSGHTFYCSDKGLVRIKNDAKKFKTREGAEIRSRKVGGEVEGIVSPEYREYYRVPDQETFERLLLKRLSTDWMKVEDFMKATLGRALISQWKLFAKSDKVEFEESNIFIYSRIRLK